MLLLWGDSFFLCLIIYPPPWEVVLWSAQHWLWIRMDLICAFDWLRPVRKSTVFVLAVVQRRYIEQPAYPFSRTNNALWISVWQIKPKDAWARGTAFRNHLRGLQRVLFKEVSAALESFF